MSEPHAKQPFVEHLIELRRRLWIVSVTLLVTFAIGYLISDQTFAVLTHPLKEAFGPEAQRRLIYTGMPEVFLTKIKLALFTAFLLAFPVIASQLYLFIAPGLYRHERRMVLPFLVTAPILFFLGAALAYFYIFPAAWEFFLSFEMPGDGIGLPVMLEPKVNEYLALSMHIILAFGLSFQLPVVLTLMARFGLVSSRTLRKGWRYAVVILIVVAGVLTPPDVYSQLGLFTALYLLYELSILVCRWIEKPQEPDSADA